MERIGEELTGYRQVGATVMSKYVVERWREKEECFVYFEER